MFHIGQMLKSDENGCFFLFIYYQFFFCYIFFCIKNMKLKNSIFFQKQRYRNRNILVVISRKSERNVLKTQASKASVVFDATRTNRVLLHILPNCLHVTQSIYLTLLTNLAFGKKYPI
jgi:hypothetical protein